jgi:hypothetical protein
VAARSAARLAERARHRPAARVRLWNGAQAWGPANSARSCGSCTSIAPELAFDLLACFVVLLLVRNLYSAVVRARNRRAYERAQANGCPDGLPSHRYVIHIT